ncbi:MAG: RNA polymerase subunit sigma [Acidobacteria bacterium]|nr:MAG: RNA polymerase subunit sigma [Acidobacteriota bacterium]REJ97956.1 MAG: RNA polymerase subunit sigma [Acidobacteriota bacterium]REK16699.1 MAG: RNA polymerase subunit sigma [Acidobacteriota bacterium]REK42610.1 MAG: RNA polymerase subunit sigma [Acidobacteriota bacterium]
MESDNTLELFEAEAIQYLNELYRTANRLTMDHSEAEELVQETYMQAWKSFSKYEPGTNCRAWLYKILFNKFDHHRRKKYTKAKYLTEADEFVFENATGNEPVSERINDRQILTALDKLPEHYRSVLVLSDVQDFEYKEIAEILDIPIGTVMSRLNRARGMMKKSLARVAVEYGVIRAEAALLAAA